MKDNNSLMLSMALTESWFLLGWLGCKDTTLFQKESVASKDNKQKKVGFHVHSTACSLEYNPAPTFLVN